MSTHATQPGPDAYAKTRLPGAGTVASGTDATMVTPGGPTNLDPGHRARVGHYEFIRLLGQGGMGSVHLARDTRLGRKVAIKAVHSDLGDQRERFLREARATARFQHENIVVIHDVLEEDSQLFMVLEHLSGRQLRDLIVGRAIKPRRAVEWMIPVVRALVAAHERGIVHRDLKPENLFLTDSGLIKVLDFGIAKMVGELHAASGEIGGDTERLHQADMVQVTQEGAVVGTMLYMAPEQWAGEEVDGRADQWAVGLMLYEMVLGHHPLSGRTVVELANVARGEEPLPPIGQLLPEVPGDLERVITRCLALSPDDRFGSTSELLDQLQAMLPTRFAPQLGADATPYPGLAAFQERDAARFFGRSRDIGRVVSRLEQNPLVAVVGPSGVGKSSLVRAGVLPTLKAHENWECLVTRPGRNPLDALAAVLLQASTASGVTTGDPLEKVALMRQQLIDSPGKFGEVLRGRCTTKGSRLLLFVDQFEELFTLAGELEERQLVLRCLLGAADDAGSPVRVVVSLRSDFLDRVAEAPDFLTELTRGLVVLQMPKWAQLEEALVRPAELLGYRFEDDGIVTDMMLALEGQPGALPLLQFAASHLWEQRDRDRKLLTRRSYDGTGGITGLLASHADEVLAGLPNDTVDLQKAVFRRLVTPEGTRAVVGNDELSGLGRKEQVSALLDRLISARLLVAQQQPEGGATYEIAHEALIEAWPTLRRWLAEGKEHAGFVARLAAAAREWDGNGRPNGLLWTGESADDARHFRRHYLGPLAPRERDFLDAVLQNALRAVKRRRYAVIGIIAALVAIVIAGGVALVRISAAEEDAKKKADEITRQSTRIEQANIELQAQIDAVKKAERRRLAAAAKAKEATEAAKKARDETKSKAKDLQLTREQLAEQNKTLKATVVEVRAAKKRADELRKAAEASKAEVTAANSKLEAQKRKLEAQKRELEAKKNKAEREKAALQKRLNRLERGKLR